MFGVDSRAQLVIINKISASELRRKSIKSALLVGKEEEALNHLFLDLLMELCLCIRKKEREAFILRRKKSPKDFSIFAPPY